MGMGRLIDADELAKIINEFDMKYFQKMLLRQGVAQIPAVEVVHGRWEKHGKHDWRCSVCKSGVPYSFTGHAYCHNCGAKMTNKE